MAIFCQLLTFVIHYKWLYCQLLVAYMQTKWLCCQRLVGFETIVFIQMVGPQAGAPKLGVSRSLLKPSHQSVGGFGGGSGPTQNSSSLRLRSSQLVAEPPACPVTARLSVPMVVPPGNLA